jgi:hypothetical protein
VSARQKPLHQEVAKFVEWHLGRGCFAPHTGQDWPAWRGFVYLVECYSHGGGEAAIAAMRATVRCAQPHGLVLRTFVQAIPAVMDWGDVRRLWPQIAEGIQIERDVYTPSIDARELHAIERTILSDKSERIAHHGWLRDENRALPRTIIGMEGQAFRGEKP